MKLGVFALSLASLCIPTVVVAQTSTGMGTTGTMTTTPSVTCSSGGNCQIDQGSRSTLGTGTPSGSGALRTTPGAAEGSTLGSGTGTTGAVSPLNNTLNSTAPGATGNSAAGTLVPATPEESIETNRGTSTAAPTVLPPPGASSSTLNNGAVGPLAPATPGEPLGGGSAGSLDTGGSSGTSSGSSSGGGL